MTITLNTQDIGLSVNDAAEAILNLTDSNEGTTTEQVEEQAENSLDETVEEETESTEDLDDEEDLDEDSESEEGEDDEDEETDEDSDEDEVEEYFEVTISSSDGTEEVLEVTQEELVNGYLRQSDYTKKRQKESEEHKTKIEELDSQIQEYSEGLTDFVTETELKLYEYQQIDWDALKSEDPETFNQLYADALYTEKKYRDAQARLDEIKKGAADKIKEQQEAYLSEQKELVQTLIPEWGEVQGAIKSYLVQEGFSDTELSAITNAKIAVLADKARKFDELKTKRENISQKKLSKKVPKMVKSGTPSSGSGKNKAAQKATARLQKTGSIDDAVAVLLSRNS